MQIATSQATVTSSHDQPTPIAIESWNPSEVGANEEITLAEHRRPIAADNLSDAVRAASLLTTPGTTYALFRTNHGFEAARALRQTWGLGGERVDFRVDDGTRNSTVRVKDHELVSLVSNREWQNLGHDGEFLPVVGDDARTQMTVRFHGTKIPLVLAGYDLDRSAANFSSKWTLDDAIKHVSARTRDEQHGFRFSNPALAIRRDPDGDLAAYRIVNREQGPNRDTRFNFEHHASELSVESFDDPALLALVDGDDVIRRPA